MNVNEIFTPGGKRIKNPNYTASNGQPEYIMSTYNNGQNLIAQSVKDAAERGELNVLGSKKELKKYEEYGITPTTFENLDKQLANAQSNWEKAKNAGLQIVGSEVVLGTLLGISDIVDFFANIGNENNDYTNPVSESLRKAQESFKEWAPIYTDPDVNISNGGLLDAGWWLSNLPSVASTVTLMIPGMGVTKGVSLLGKLAKVDKVIGWGRRSLTGLRNFEKLDKAAQLAKYKDLSKAQRFINGRGKDMANEFFETAINAGTMRIAENYQEARDTYSQMYEQASESFNNPENFKKFLTNNKELPNDLDTTDKDAVARYVAKQAADKTFAIDAWNFISDFIELKALQDVGKLAKNVKQTAKVRKAERLAKQQAAVDAGLITAETAESTTKGIKNQIGNWLSDHRNSGNILFAELSEGVEESVNYVAQQEGIHLGNLMLSNDENTSFDYRFYNSYLNSPELYESAFWGWMGGVLFQSFGGKIKQAGVALDKYGSKLFNKNDSETTGQKSTSWSDAWELPTTKRQIEEINKRAASAEDFRKKLDMINSKQNPYEVLEDGKTPKSIFSDEEELALRERAVDDYVADITMRAIDVGNYDALIDYLEDENVEALLKQKGIIDENNNVSDKQDIINKVKQVADKYQENLFLINTISGTMSSGVPMEYQQIIARDNTQAQLKIENIDKRIRNYEDLSEQHKRVYKNNLENAGFGEGIDYRTSIFLVEASQRLGELQAQKRAIVDNSEFKNSVSGQDAVRAIDRQIDAINQQLTDSEDEVLNAARLLWAYGASTRFVYDENLKKTKVDSTNKRFVEFADLFNNAATTRNRQHIKELNDFLGIDFRLTDQHIESLFGNVADKGAYQILNEDLSRLYPASTVKESRDKIAKGIKEAAPSLHEDYINLSALQFAKIYEESLINTTTKNISRRVQELDNFMNDKRIKAKEKAYKVLDTLEEKYGIEPVLDYLDNNSNSIENITDSEQKLLDDAVAILDLQKEANSSLFDEISYRLLNNKITRLKNQINDGENSTTIFDNNSNTENQNVVNSSTPDLNVENEPTNSENKDLPPTIVTEKGKGKLQLNLNVDSELESNLVADTDENIGVHYETDSNGNIILKFDEDEDNEAYRELSGITKSHLFDITDNSTPGEIAINVVKNPILNEEDGKYNVIEKGQIEITDKNRPEPKFKVGDKFTFSNKEITVTKVYPNGNFDAKSDDSSISMTNMSEEDYNRLVTDSSTGEQDKTNEGTTNNEEELDTNKIADINNKLQQAFGAIRRDSAFADKSELEKLQAAVDLIKNDPSYNKDTDEIILTQAAQTITNVLKRRGIDLDVADLVLHSSISEKVNTGFSDNYINAVDKLVETYAKKYDLPIINGKVYINLANVLRDINEEYNDNKVANLIYSQFVNYVTSELGNEKYVVTDMDPKHPNFIQEITKDLQERIFDSIGDSSIHRVNIYEYLNNADTKKALGALKQGDKLEVKIDGTKLILLSNGVKVGNIPSVNITTSGAYQQNNMGWITTISKRNEIIQCDVKDAIIKILTDNKYNDTLNKLWQYSYDKSLSKTNKTKFINDIYSIIKSDFNPLLATTAEKKDVVNFLSNLIKYVNSNGFTSKNKKRAINSLDNYFENIYESYRLADSLFRSIFKGKNDFIISVDKVTEGQINHNNLSTNDPDRKNYDLMIYANEAIDEAHKNKEDGRTVDIGFVNQNGTAIVCKNKTIERSGLRPGLPYVILSNGTEESHILGTSVRLTDSTKKGPAKLLKAINTELDTLIENASKDLAINEWNNLTKFLWQLTGKYHSKWNGNAKINRLYPSNIPLFRGLHWSTTGNGNYIHVQNGEFNIQINANGEFLVQDIKNGNTFNKFNIQTEEGKNKFKQIITSFKNSLTFNIDENFINEIPTGLNTNSLTIIGPNEFTVSIPNSKTNSYETFTYPSFTDFVIGTGIVKLDTHVGKNGSNFEAKGDNQLANQLLNVKVTRNSSPVEDIDIDITTNTTNTLNILNDDSIEDKAIELVKDDFTEEELNSLKELELLPKTIIFDENFNTLNEINGVNKYEGENAEVNLETGIVTIGNRWVSMFNETGEFAGANGFNRAQAIRKLIHEQLHLQLDINDKQLYLNRIEEIYNDFKNSLDNVTDSNIKDRLSQYLFSSEEREVALEEFLVESLTSEELVNYLNSVDSTFEKGELEQSLWQKILKLLSDIFHWNVREGSLREKELYTLQKEISNIEKGLGKVKTEPESESKIEPKTEDNTEPEIEPKEETKKKGLGLLSKKKGNTRGSSITESAKNDVNSYLVQNLGVFTDSLPLSEQAQFMGRIERGERKLTCSI